MSTQQESKIVQSASRKMQRSGMKHSALGIQKNIPAHATLFNRLTNPPVKIRPVCKVTPTVRPPVIKIAPQVPQQPVALIKIINIDIDDDLAIRRITFGDENHARIAVFESATVNSEKVDSVATTADYDSDNNRGCLKIGNSYKLTKK